MNIMEYQGCGMHFGVFREGMEARGQLFEKDLPMKELCEHPGRTATPMPDRGGPRHLHRGLGITEEQM